MNRPNTPAQVSKALPCSCVSAGDFQVKSAAANGQFKPVIKQRTLPTAGAAFQDATYGKGMRLHNQRISKGKDAGMTCTICGAKRGA